MKARFHLALAAFFLLLPWIFFDIDLGDQSYHSLSSWLMAFHPKMPAGELPLWFEQVPVWFSCFVDAVWWKIIGPDAPLVAVRFGWIFFQVGILLALYEAFLVLFPARKLFTPLLLGLMAVNSAADHFVLSYYVVPPAIGALAFAFLAAGIKENEKIFYVISGMAAALAIQARLPSVLPLGGCIAGIFLLTGFWAKDIPRSLTGVGFFLAGLVAGTAFAFACLLWMGQAEYYLPGIESFWAGISDATNHRYSKGVVLERAVGHYIRIAIGATIFAAFYFAMEKIGRWKNWIFCFALFMVCLLACAKYGTVLAMIIGGGFLLVGLVFWERRKSLESWEIAFFLGAFGALSAFTLGTFLEGVQTFKYGLWLIIPFALLIQPERRRDLSTRWLGGAVVLLFLVTRLLWPTFPFLERPIYRMTSSFGLEGAVGLRTYLDKAESLRGLVTKLKELGLEKGSEFFVYSGVPTYYPVAGIYLLTRTLPLLHDPGLVEYPGARWKNHKNRLEELAIGGRLPRLIVRQKELMPRVSPSARSMLRDVWTFNPVAPEIKFQWTSGKENYLAGEVDEILRAANYRVLWENSYFVVLGPNR
ncbi:MAG: hypothetical protein AB7K68_05370 [Bacteriovoracia bacterium]